MGLGALEADVAVVGGGMAGACAALAARSAGASVLLLVRAPGATAVSSGAVDLAASEGDTSIIQAAALLAGRSDHPYALLGGRLRPALEAALATLRQLGLSGARSVADRNLLLATPLGKRKAAALAQPSIAAGDLRALPDDARIGVASLAGPQALEARLVAAGLGGVALPVEIFTAREDAQLQLPQLAARLDRDADLRGKLGDQLGKAARRAGATHVFMPTLGLDDPGKVKAELQEAAHLPVFELLSAPPSVPGLRLQRMLMAALSQAGVQVLPATAERSASHALQAVQGAELSQVQAKAVVLAGGKFLGGGVRAAADGALRESALGLPAFAGERQKLAALLSEELVAQRVGGRQRALEAGLRVDHELRPIDAEGKPALANGAAIFAAGALVAGYDPARGDGGLGVAAVLGCEAGRRAAEAAR